MARRAAGRQGRLDLQSERAVLGDDAHRQGCERKVVYTATGETAAGNNDFAWDGTDMNGNQLPDGKYTLSIQATAADGSAVDSTIASKAMVTAVDMSGTTPMLVLGAMEIPLSDVSLVGANS